MAHTTKQRDITFIHDQEAWQGLVSITNETGEVITVPGSDLFAFVLGQLRDKQVASLEALTSKDLLKRFKLL